MNPNQFGMIWIECSVWTNSRKADLFQSIPNYFPEPISKTFWIFGSCKLVENYSDLFWFFLRFQSYLIQANFLIQINPRTYWFEPNSQSESIWNNSRLQLFELKVRFKLNQVKQSYSELFPILFPNRSQKRFEFRLMENDKKLIRFISVQSWTSFRMNLNEVFNPMSPKRIDLNRISNLNESEWAGAVPWN